jgi:hypothetical protein
MGRATPTLELAHFGTVGETPDAAERTTCASMTIGG